MENVILLYHNASSVPVLCASYCFIKLHFRLMFQELEEILTDVTSAVSEAICTGGEIITDKVFSNTIKYNTKTLTKQ